MLQQLLYGNNALFTPYCSIPSDPMLTTPLAPNTDKMVLSLPEVFPPGPML